MPSATDFVIRNAVIADGTGGPLTGGDVAIGDGRIITAGAEPAPAGPSTVDLDAHGELICSPGFIDVHTHDDAALIRHPDLEFKVAQGCTSLIIGNCGFSGFPATGLDDIESVAGGDWTDLDGYGRAVNAAGCTSPTTRQAVAKTGAKSPIRSPLLTGSTRRGPTSRWTSIRTSRAAARWLSTPVRRR